MKGLTLTAIFEASSLNYSETVGNISELKKLTRDGEVYTYMSRQALRYEVFRKLRELYNVDAYTDEKVPLSDDNGVIQFKPTANIKDYVEVDLFGYMKTEKSKKSKEDKDNMDKDNMENDKDSSKNNNSAKAAKTRSAVVRFSPAISLSPIAFDVEFGANHDFAKRANTNPNPFQFEVHSSLYTYTVAIDLDRVGVDPNDGLELDGTEKARRVNMVLDALKILDREIKGRTENLSPLFVIGGLYPVKNPFFLGRIKVNYDRNQRKYSLNTKEIESVLGLKLNGKSVKDYTSCGLVKGFWANEDYIIQNLKEKTISDFFEELKSKVDEHYKK
jgi:CRISPR-associated protein Cst2